MKKSSLANLIFQNAHEKLCSYTFLCDARVSPNYFSRTRKIGFIDIMLYLISGVKISLQAGINAFMDKYGRKTETYSKQAFSQARQKIKPEAFQELSMGVVQDFYRYADSKTFQGYHLLAIDGSRYNLPCNTILEEAFGAQITGGAPQVQALGSCIYDVLNGIIVDAQFGHCKSNERIQAAEMIKKVDADLIQNPVYLVDRGYPSSDLIEQITAQKQHYLMRCDATFIRGIQRDETDFVLEYKFKKSKVHTRFRLITVTLDNGTEEYLITNLFDEDLTEQDFKHLYHLRWGIETLYADLKSKMQIENFTGHTPIAVQQDFYATLFLANLAGILAFAYRDEIEATHNDSENKHVYKLNVNMSISLLKQNVIELLLYDDPHKRSKLFDRITKRLRSCVVPIRPKRSAPRIRRHLLSKFPPNIKLP